LSRSSTIKDIRHFFVEPGLIRVRNFGRNWAAGGWDDAVEAEVERHLAVVVGGMPDDGGGKAEAGGGRGVGTFDRVEHIFLVDGGEGFIDGRKRIAEIDQQFLFCFGGIGATFVASGRGSGAVEFSREAEVGAGDVLDLFREGAELRRAVAGCFVLEIVLDGAKAVFFFGHGLGGGADLVLLKTETAGEGGGNGFLLGQLGGGGRLGPSKASDQEDKAHEKDDYDADGDELSMVAIHGDSLLAVSEFFGKAGEQTEVRSTGSVAPSETRGFVSTSREAR